MLLSPASVFTSWYRRFFSIGLVIAGAGLIVGWYISRNQRHEAGTLPWFELWKPGHVLELIALVVGGTFLAWTFAGRHFQRCRLSSKDAGSIPTIPPGETKTILRPDGTKLFVEIRGSSELPTVILIHGWSLNSKQWVYLQSEWQNKFRVVVWDLPGLGKSTAAAGHDLTLENMAEDLRAVIEATDSAPAILLGHSIGGMIILTFCQMFPELLGPTVSKLILVHTTYINPLQTMANGSLWIRLQKRLIEPLIYLQIHLWPIVWMMDYLAYWNGSLYRALRRTGFAGTETRSQLDFVARFYVEDSPAILAEGALAMLAYDASQTLPTIKIPVLVVGGESDPLTELQASHKIAAEVEHGELIVLAPAKHFGLIEHHTEFARKTSEFCLAPAHSSVNVAYPVVSLRSTTG